MIEIIIVTSVIIPCIYIKIKKFFFNRSKIYYKSKNYNKLDRSIL